jgi:hypothetical protein
MANSVKKETDASPDLTRVKGQFDEYVETTANARRNAEKCRDYRDGNQWTENERKVLEKRKQPCITDNKIQDKCDTLLGMEKQMRTDPKAYPRTAHETEAAEVATDALRYVADGCDYQRTSRKPAADNLIVEGACFGQVIVEKRKGKAPKVAIEHIRWDRGYYDPHSLRDDFDDAMFKGYFTWLDEAVASGMYPARKDALDASFNGESQGMGDKSLDDKPRYTITTNGRKRVQVFKHYEKLNGIWHESVWCKGGFLEDPAPCKYLDENGEPQCCIEIQALYRDSDGNPYGAVPRYLDLQDEHNKRRSKMLHLLNAKRVVAQRGMFDDLNALRNEVHKADGVIEVPGDIAQFRVEDNLNEAQGQWQLLQQTEIALAATGPNAALAGQSGTLSGRAKQLDQASGAIAVAPIFEALESWEVRIYRQCWNRIKQYWTAEVWIRVTDDEEKYKFVVLNQPVTKADLAAQHLGQQQMPDEQKKQLIEQMGQDPTMQQPAMDEQGKPVIKNHVAEIDVDIIIDRSPDMVTLQEEQFGILAELAKSRPEVPFEVLIEASSLRSEIKKSIKDKISGQDNPMAQQMAAMQQRMADLEAMQKQADIQNTAADTALKGAQTQKTMADAAVGVADASAPEPETVQ